MSEIIIQTLKKLKGVQPQEDFKKRSLTLILNSPQKKEVPFLKNVVQAFQFGGALVLASLILLIVFSSFHSPSQLTGLDNKNLNAELQDLDLKIKLAEVKYYEDPLNKTDVALKETVSPAKSQTDNENLENLLKELVF